MSTTRAKRSKLAPHEATAELRQSRDNVVTLAAVRRSKPSFAPETASEKSDPKGAESGLDAVIDGRRITLEADTEIVLRCGKSSITLTRSGKIILRGTHVVSRSSGANRVQGAQVRIN